MRPTFAAVLAVVIGGSAVTRGEPPTTQLLTTAAAAPATQPGAAGRDAVAIKTDLQIDLAAFQSAYTGPQMLTDPAARKAAAPALIQVLRKVYGDYGDLAAAVPAAKVGADEQQSQFTVMLSTFGDADATARLAAQAGSADPAVAVAGQGQQLLVQWWLAGQDAVAQGKVADRAAALAKAHPDSVPLTQQLVAMEQVGPAGPAQAARVQSVITDVMKNELADQFRQQFAADQKLAALAGKPLAVAGTTLDGRPFTTADWKGKVVLVDFWATWCVPCRIALPEIEKAYADHHAQGLEVLGVSNDRSADQLKKFLAANPQMPWPQLFDPAAAARQDWNRITLGYGVNSLPTLFLIDRKGVCRTVDARSQLDDLIPKLLAEQ